MLSIKRERVTIKGLMSLLGIQPALQNEVPGHGQDAKRDFAANIATHITGTET